MTELEVPRSVVAGVDGSESALRAVRFAALEAQHLGTGLDIVHVTPAYTPVGPALPMVADQSLRDYGENVLRVAEEEARATLPDLAVRTVLFTGGRVPGLVDSARTAPLLVVGATERGALERIWTGTTVTGVAARSTCPVVVVPEEWDPGTRHRRVVAGFKSPPHAGELFGQAFALAAREDSELLVLHAWQMMSGYDDIVTNRVAEDEWRHRQTEIIEPLLTDLRAVHPQVPVRLEVVHDQPAHALVRHGREADRLIMMRPVHGGFVHHLGAVARAVLREATCPIEIVPPVRTVGP